MKLIEYSKVQVKIEPLDRSDEQKGRPSVITNSERNAKKNSNTKKENIRYKLTKLHDPRTIHTNARFQQTTKKVFSHPTTANPHVSGRSCNKTVKI